MKLKFVAALALLVAPAPALALDGPTANGRGGYDIRLTRSDRLDAEGRARVLEATRRAAKKICFDIETRGKRRACEAAAIERAAALSPTVRQALAERTPVQVAER